MTIQTHRSAWNSSLELVRGLVTAGARVSLGLVGGALAGDQRRELRRMKGVEVVRDKEGGLLVARSAAERRRLGTLLLAEADRINARVVHLDGISHLDLPWGRPTLVSIRTSQFAWWSAVRRTPQPVSWERYRAMMCTALRRADAVAVPTHIMREQLRMMCGDDIRTHVVYAGRDPYRFRPGLKSPYILALGNVRDEAKNLAVLDDVVAGLPWPILIAGSPQEPGRIEMGKARTLGMLPSNEMGQWLSHASIFALPARHEPLGVSVLEAALSGAALVLGDIPELRELWNDVALFVSPDDPVAVRHAIEALIADAELRRTFGVRARLRAMHFSPARMAAAYLELYRALSPKTILPSPLPTATRLPGSSAAAA